MSENPYLICEDSIPVIVPKRIMVFAGHPDDELISCGGTILKYLNLGSEINIIIATTGSGGYTREQAKEIF